MPTLIAIYSSDGCVGRCDAKCYNAEHAKCPCVCGGANHGKGLAVARDNTLRLADEWLAESRERLGRPDATADVLPGSPALPLFGEAAPCH